MEWRISISFDLLVLWQVLRLVDFASGLWIYLADGNPFLANLSVLAPITLCQKNVLIFSYSLNDLMVPLLMLL